MERSSSVFWGIPFVVVLLGVIFWSLNTPTRPEPTMASNDTTQQEVSRDEIDALQDELVAQSGERDSGSSVSVTGGLFAPDRRFSELPRTLMPDPLPSEPPRTLMPDPLPSEPHPQSSQSPVIYSPMPPTPLVYWGDATGHWIIETSGDGRIIVLEDRSVWEVHPVDRPISALWLPATDIVVVESNDPLFPYRLINKDDNETVVARLISQ